MNSAKAQTSNVFVVICAALCAVILGTFLTLGATSAYFHASAYADISADPAIGAELSAGNHVVDQSELLSAQDAANFETTAQQLASIDKVDAYFISVNSLQGEDTAEDFTDEFIETYRLSSKSENGCVVFLICLNERQYALISDGAVARQLSDSALNSLSDTVSPLLGNANWSGAVETYYQNVQQALGGQASAAAADVAYNGTYVIDAYGLFSDEQRQALEAKATQLAQDYNMGVYLLVVDTMGSQNPSESERTSFATNFYSSNKLGLGPNHDGIMFVIAAGSRDYITIGYGQGSYSFSDEGIAEIESQVTSYLRSNDWYGGSGAYYSVVGEQLEYYSVKGEPWTEPDPLSLILKILAILGIPSAVAFGEINRERGIMVTAREKRTAEKYMDSSSLALTASEDTFVNTTVAVVPVPRHDDDKGSSFGGGGWGGGGGGGFSSSGGGKF